METFASLDQKIEKLGWSKMDRFLGQKEIKHLTNVLMADEELIHIVQGNLNSKQGVLFLSNKRIGFYDKGFFFGAKLESFPLKQVASINYGSGIMFAEIAIYNTGRSGEIIRNVAKDKAKSFVDKVTEILTALEEAPQAMPTSNFSIGDELKKLADLRDSGVLTESEFLIQKQRILG